MKGVTKLNELPKSLGVETKKDAVFKDVLLFSYLVVYVHVNWKVEGLRSQKCIK